MDGRACPANQSLALLKLLTAEGIGPATARRLVDGLGTPDQVIQASPVELARACHLRLEAAVVLARAIAASDPTREQERLASLGARFLPWSEPGYPESLCRIPDPPPVLRVRGSSLDDLGIAIAVVGTRRCSAYGSRQASRFASAMASVGITIISGGARGIDAEAHRAALRLGGRTISVLGSGLAHPYPAEHEDLFDEIAVSGGTIISEYPVDQPPRPAQFPRRNRLVAGLAIGVLVIEAPRRSGAMITARLAVEDQGREAWAVPGSVEHHNSEGCHRAIAEGWAALVQSPGDLLQWIDDSGWFRSASQDTVDMRPAERLDDRCDHSLEST